MTGVAVSRSTMGGLAKADPAAPKAIAEAQPMLPRNRSDFLDIAPVMRFPPAHANRTFLRTSGLSTPWPDGELNRVG